MAMKFLPLADERFEELPALAEDEGPWLSHGQLRAVVYRLAGGPFSGARGLVLVLTRNRISIVAAYLAALAANHALLLLDGESDPETVARLVAAYRPRFLVATADWPEVDWPCGAVPLDSPLVDLLLLALPSDDEAFIHPNLALLLSTSGSTGSRRMVRLSHTAMRANTSQVIAALGIGSDHRAIGHMPLAYSYGLSVLNTHLAAGASMVLTDRTPTRRDFFELVRDRQVGSLPVVPFQLDLIARLDFGRMELLALKTLTQAGGRGDPGALLRLAERLRAVGGRIFVMYGQTEAGPRMTTLDPDHLLAKPGSVGRPMLGGRIDILGQSGQPVRTGEVGEVVYSGFNVMMGYAESAADLSRDDEIGGRLATGDLGYLDSDGDLWITGRIKRIAKILGHRLNLDEVEASVGQVVQPIAVVEAQGRIVLVLERPHAGQAARAERHVVRRTGLPDYAVGAITIDRMVRVANGKLDYPYLTRYADLTLDAAADPALPL